MGLHYVTGGFGLPNINIATFELYDHLGAITANWDTLYLNSFGFPSIDWGNRQLMDMMGVMAIEYGTPTTARAMYNQGGVKVLDFADGLLLTDYTTITSPAEGMIGFDFTNHVVKFYNGAAWAAI